MKRPFDFDITTRQQAFKRQWNKCAHCGDNLNNIYDHAHHVVPNQLGKATNPNDDWIRNVDNCVVLCEPCHNRVHENGNYRSGAVAPPDYFPFSHGLQRPLHLIWKSKMEKLFWGK